MCPRFSSSISFIPSASLDTSLHAECPISHVTRQRRGFRERWQTRQSCEDYVNGIAEPPDFTIRLWPAWTAGGEIPLTLVAGVAPVASRVAMMPVVLTQVAGEHAHSGWNVQDEQSEEPSSPAPEPLPKRQVTAGEGVTHKPTKR